MNDQREVLTWHDFALGVKSCGALNVELYTGVGTRLPEPVILPPILASA